MPGNEPTTQELSESEQVGFTFWPHGGAGEGPAVAVTVIRPGGTSAGALVPWEDFQRMTESMYAAWQEAQGREIE